MKWLIVALALLLLAPKSSATAPDESSNERSVSYFEVHLGVMSRFFPKTKETYVNFLVLKRVDEEAANFIAELWHMKVRMQHEELLEKQADQAARRLTKDLKKSSVDSDAANEAAFESTKLVFIGYYLDHWSDVSDSISDLLKFKIEGGSSKGANKASTP